MLITKIFNNTISSFLSIWQIEKEQTIFLEKRNKQFDIYTKKKKDTFIRTKGEDSSAYTWASWTAVRPRNRSPILTHSSTRTKATTNGGDQNTVEFQNRDRKLHFYQAAGGAIVTRSQSRSLPAGSRRVPSLPRREEGSSDGGQTVPIPGLFSLEWRGHTKGACCFQ